MRNHVHRQKVTLTPLGDPSGRATSFSTPVITDYQAVARQLWVVWINVEIRFKGSPFLIQKEKLMSAKLKTQHAAAAVLIASSLAISSGTSFAQMANMPMSKDAPNAATKSASGTGTVIALNAASKKIKFDHGPLPEIGWPKMKMEFPVASSVDLSKVKIGDKVRFTLAGSGKTYTVQSISPQ